MNILKDQLWNYFQMIHQQEHNEEKIKILDDLLEKEDAMRETFSAEQTTLFFLYNDSVGQYHSLNEQEAFISGVQITSALFLEIIRMIYNNPFNQ